MLHTWFLGHEYKNKEGQEVGYHYEKSNWWHSKTIQWYFLFWGEFAVCTAFMECKRWGRIVGWRKGLFVSLVNSHVTIYSKEYKTIYRTSFGILDHKGCEEQCGWLEET